MKAGKLQRTKCIFKNLEHFYYTNSELSERKIKKTLLLTVASKNVNQLGMSLTKEVKACTMKTVRHR